LTFNKGSLILVDYTAKVKDTEEVFDTTIEEDAKKHSIHEQNFKYQPKRDSGKVRMIPIRKLGEDAERVSVGDSIEVDNKKGIIRYIGSGRVQVDYNHRYAGKTILFDVNVIKSLDTPNDKIDSILKNRLPVEDAKIAFDLKDKEVNITIPEEILRADGLQIMKHFIQLDVFKFAPALEKVSFVETHVNKQAQEKKPETKEKTPEQKTT
jgi:peptidylprolyl isomerase